MNGMASHRHVPSAIWGAALAKAMESSKDLKTQCALARKSGVPQSTIGRILRGETSPQSDTLQRLAEALRIPLATLFDVERVDSLDSAQRQDEQIDRALFQALAAREDRKRAQATLEDLTRREEEAVEQLQALVRGRGEGKAP